MRFIEPRESGIGILCGARADATVNNLYGIYNWEERSLRADARLSCTACVIYAPEICAARVPGGRR